MELLVVTGSLLFWGGVSGVPPALQCPLLDERGSIAPRPARLLLFGGGEGGETPPRDPQNPARDPPGTFHVIDPRDSLRGFWDPSPPRCELSPTTPLLPLPPPQTPPGACPRRVGEGQEGVGEGPWWLLRLGTPKKEGTALLEGGGAGRGDPPRVHVSLLVFTLTPTLEGVSGSPRTLHCAFSPPPEGFGGGPFTLTWLHHRGGVTRTLLTFHSPSPTSSPTTQAAPGVLLLMGGSSGPLGGAEEAAGGALEVSLQLPPLRPSDGGSFVCSVTTPRGHAQQVLRLHVIAPPQVTLHPPSPVLPPGEEASPIELRCDAVGFFPLDVTIRWELLPEEEEEEEDPSWKKALPLPPGAVSWSSGHRRAADGTFSRSAGLRVPRGRPGQRFGCRVEHPGLGRPRRVSVTLRGAGDVGPGLEDVAGVALVAFALGGLCLRLWPPQGG